MDEGERSLLPGPPLPPGRPLPPATSAAPMESTAFRTAWWQRLLADPSTYQFTRFAILRLLAFVYLAAFVCLLWQGRPLLGAHGLLPAQQFLARAARQLGAVAYWRVPTLFWLGCSDAAMNAARWCGIVLSLAALAGVTHALVQLALWAIYLSFVHVGQIFYGYGWELQLLETGFLAVFLCPLRSGSPFPRFAAPKVVFWLFRWLIFRVMLGAALIKLRGDSCWRDLTCLDFHFETQPNPNPLSFWFHHAPHAVHAFGVLVNHFVELVAPWFVFALRPYRRAAGACLVGFQLFLIASGNLSFLNWLTIVPALACFDDAVWAKLLAVGRRSRAAFSARLVVGAAPAIHRIAAWVLAFVVAVLSAAPVLNLFSSHQTMNGSFDPLDLVNTYGAFGSVDRARYEVILEGTSAAVPDRSAQWEEYELPCTTGDPRRRPCLVSPYHYRLDWQMWFVGNGAARGESVGDNPWLVHLIWQLLSGSPSPKKLFWRDPFPAVPPKWIRADVWHYWFAADLAGGTWWRRERVGVFVGPLSLQSAPLQRYVRGSGWADGPGDM